MSRTIAALCLAIGFAHSASSATLSVASDKLTYSVGETITLTVTGDDEGTVALSAVGQLLYSGALVDNGTRSQTNLGPGWNEGSLLASDDGINAYSLAFDQLRISDYSVSPNLPGTLSVVTLIAQAIGVVDVNWNPTLSFFGLTSAPGTSFSIVPEPTTGALLVLGLLALGVARRPVDSR